MALFLKPRTIAFILILHKNKIPDIQLHNDHHFEFLREIRSPNAGKRSAHANRKAYTPSDRLQSVLQIVSYDNIGTLGVFVLSAW